MDIETITRHAKKEFENNGLAVELAYIYGSFAKGKEKAGSDIDIAILLKEDKYVKNPLNMLGKVQNLAERIEKRIKRDVDIRILNRASVSYSYIVVTTGIPIYTSSKMTLFRYQNKILGMFFDFRPFLETYLNAYAGI